MLIKSNASLSLKRGLLLLFPFLRREKSKTVDSDARSSETSGSSH